MIQWLGLYRVSLAVNVLMQHFIYTSHHGTPVQ